MDTSVRSALRNRSGSPERSPQFTKRRVSEVPRAISDVPPGEHYRPIDPREEGGGLANVLGLVSLGLGITQLVAPDSVARLVGLEPTDRTRSTMRALGVVLGVTALDALGPRKFVNRRQPIEDGNGDDNGYGQGAGGRAPSMYGQRYGAGRNTISPGRMRKDNGGRRVTNIITVNRSVEEVYGFWRNFENLPRFMRHLVSVNDMGNGRSHWKAMAPAGTTVEWDAEITEDRPNERISWRSLPGATVRNAGTVTFTKAPGNRGTEVRVDLEYRPPAGKLGAMVAMLFREEPGQQIHDDLRNFKQVLEIGEILLSDATKRKGMHPAQPSDEPVEMKV